MYTHEEACGVLDIVVVYNKEQEVEVGDLEGGVGEGGGRAGEKATAAGDPEQVGEEEEVKRFNQFMQRVVTLLVLLTYLLSFR